MGSANIYTVEISKKAFIVLGDTITHAKNLYKLGGFNSVTRVYGNCIMFQSFRRESVERYIETGTVDRAEPPKGRGQSGAQSNTRLSDRGTNIIEIGQLFEELRGAFDRDLDYEGSAIIDVLDRFEARYGATLQVAVDSGNDADSDSGVSDSNSKPFVPKQNHKRLARRIN